MIYLAAALVFTNTLMAFGFGVYVLVSSRDRQTADRLSRTDALEVQQAHDRIVHAIAEQAEAEREADRVLLRETVSAARKEREVLMDRIQRPEALSRPVPFADEPSDEPLTPAYDDDEAQWAALAEASKS